jgi:hypothetical protein
VGASPAVFSLKKKVNASLLENEVAGDVDLLIKLFFGHEETFLPHPSPSRPLLMSVEVSNRCMFLDIA